MTYTDTNRFKIKRHRIYIIMTKEDDMQKENSHEDIKKKVVGYARVSTLEQAEKGTSIDEQKRIMHEECLRRGWQLVQIYCDEGASGNLTDRQGLHNLQRDARMGNE
jgi:hypothetical protein